ncbi:hypothetical protein WJX77_005610 [Trebouxia sp. C0004]
MFSSASVQDQQSVVGSMQATILPLTEPIQRIELQPCSRCCQAEANAAESITHLSSELAKGKALHLRLGSWEPAHCNTGGPSGSPLCPGPRPGSTAISLCFNKPDTGQGQSIHAANSEARGRQQQWVRGSRSGHARM